MYRAIHKKSNTEVALKKQEIYENREEIEAEIEFMRHCHGPYVVNFYGNALVDSVMWVRCPSLFL